jgi:hypothetical protein
MEKASNFGYYKHDLIHIFIKNTKVTQSMPYLKIVLLASICIAMTFSNVYAQDLSPLKQVKSGISISDIKCKGDFVLVIKTENNKPACVKPATATRLESQGWITQETYQSLHPAVHHNMASNQSNTNTSTLKLINSTILANQTRITSTNQNVTIPANQSLF